MSVQLNAVSPLLLQRYELKYHIPASLVEPISRYIEGFCALDYYSQISPQNSYTINSLYFDSPQFLLLRRKEAGVEPTCSVRVRSYGDFPQAPYFTEIKIKKNDFSNKLRAKIQSEDWASYIQNGETPPGLDQVSASYYQQFIHLMMIYSLEPKVLTQYRRKAYLSEIDDYARVTFDSNLRYQWEDDWNVKPEESLMCHYDNEEIFDHPEDSVVLELKAEKKIPIWMLDLIKRFELTRSGFSKFGSVIRETRGPIEPPRDIIAHGTLKFFNSKHTF